MARQPDDYFTGDDRGCPHLRKLLNREVRCLACPLPKCLYDMSDEEIESVEERLDSPALPGFYSPNTHRRNESERRGGVAFPETPRNCVTLLDNRKVTN